MSTQQVLVRLPDDLATRFAQVVAPRQRSRFLIDLLRRELDRESAGLAEAALRLNEIEASSPALAAEGGEWVGTRLTPDADDDGFDANVFERQFKEAQAQRAAAATKGRKAAKSASLADNDD